MATQWELDVGDKPLTVFTLLCKSLFLNSMGGEVVVLIKVKDNVLKGWMVNQKGEMESPRVVHRGSQHVC